MRSSHIFLACRRLTLSTGTSDVTITELIAAISNAICNWKHWPSDSAPAKMCVTNNNNCVDRYERSCNERPQMRAASAHLQVSAFPDEHHPSKWNVLKLKLFFPSLFVYIKSLCISTQSITDHLCEDVEYHKKKSESHWQRNLFAVVARLRLEMKVIVGNHNITVTPCFSNISGSTACYCCHLIWWLLL